MTNNAPIPPMPEPWARVWEEPELLAAYVKQTGGVVIITLVTLLVVVVLSLIPNVGPPLALLVSGLISSAYARFEKSILTTPILLVYAIVFFVAGNLSFMIFAGDPMGSRPHQVGFVLAWLVAWSLVSMVVLFGLFRSKFVVLLVGAGTVLAGICLIFNSIGAWLLASAFWNGAAAIGLLYWSWHHRAWVSFHTRAPFTHCPRCNYDLSGLHSPTCPECGNTIPTSPPLFGSPN